MDRTLAESLGSTPHLSPLLHKTRRLGLATPDALLRLAVRRGCSHYAPPDFDPVAVDDPGQDRLPDVELAMALCSAAQPYDPMLLRCAAQLLGAVEISAPALARRARMERCEGVVRHIAVAAAKFDASREEFWRGVVAALPARPVPPTGVLPHPSRFMLHSGIAGPRRRPVAVWLRPKTSAS